MSQSKGNDLRAFRWGAVADHADAIYFHPTLSCANYEMGTDKLSKFFLLSEKIGIGWGRASF